MYSVRRASSSLKFYHPNYSNKTNKIATGYLELSLGFVGCDGGIGCILALKTLN